MKIRSQQIVVFVATAVGRFEDRMTAHLNKCFAQECGILGDGLRDMIRHGIQKAAGYGITTERDVCQYIDLMMVFGRNFDADPDLPWASSVLNYPTLNDSTIRMEHLYETAKAKHTEKTDEYGGS
jgi:hypothetical protein